MVRFPFLPKVTLGDVANQGNAYRRTGQENITPAPAKPAPVQPEGIEALQRAIESVQARQAQIVGELAEAEAQYADAALLWDTQQDIDARERMNGAAARRTALEAESRELAAELPRLQRRLRLATDEYRRQRHETDLQALDAALGEFALLLRDYKRAAVAFVQLADNLQARRSEIRALRSRITQYADATGAAKCTRDVSGETAIPRFVDTWLSGMSGSVDACKRAMGVTDSD